MHDHRDVARVGGGRNGDNSAGGRGDGDLLALGHLDGRGNLDGRAGVSSGALGDGDRGVAGGVRLLDDRGAVRTLGGGGGLARLLVGHRGGRSAVGVRGGSGLSGRSGVGGRIDAGNPLHNVVAAVCRSLVPVGDIARIRLARERAAGDRRRRA